MPRQKKAKEGLVGSFSQDTMWRALRRMEEGVKLRAAAQEFNIPFSTLWRYWQKAKGKTEEEKKLLISPNFRVKTVFCEEQERELNDHLIFASKIHHGLSGLEARLLAFELAQNKKLRIPSSWARLQTAGPDWLKGFRKRWPQLAIRKAEAANLARCSSFNRTTVNEFFNNVANAFEKIPDLHGGLVYNLDEFALTTVRNPPTVSSGKDSRRGALITACCFVNAAGATVPPLLIFPHVNFKPYVLSVVPSGTGTKLGWLNSKIFVKVLQYFQKHTKCSVESPVVLFMVCPEAHVGIEAIDFCRSNGVYLITFPPRTPKKLRPLDRSVFKSLKVHYDSACNEWMSSNVGKDITRNDVASLFREAYPKAVSQENIVDGFRCAGVWPLNSDVFRDGYFLCSLERKGLELEGNCEVEEDTELASSVS